MLTVLWEDAPENSSQRMLLERLYSIATASANIPASAEVTVLLTSDMRLRDLNRAYRDKDAPTDVLSFALREAPVGDASCKPALPIEGASNASLPKTEDSSRISAFRHEVAGCKPALPEEESEYRPAQWEERHEYLGDIAISLKRVAVQATAYGHSEARELGYLFVHGFLHLIGHTHAEEGDYQHMRELEEAILSGAGLPRCTG